MVSLRVCDKDQHLLKVFITDICTTYAMTSHNDTCPICSSDDARYGSGFITCKWEDRDDNLYFNGNVCDNCWDEIVMPLLTGNLKNNVKVVDTIKYIIGINRSDRNPLT